MSVVRLRSVTFTMGVLLAAASALTCVVADSDHCAWRESQAGVRGHAWCAEVHPEFPICSRCVSSGSGHDGCVSEEPDPMCHVGGADPVGEDASSSTSGGPMATSSSTGDPYECMGSGPEDESCPPEAPFCVDGMCVPCSAELCSELGMDAYCTLDGQGCSACIPGPEPVGCPSTQFCGAAHECDRRCTYHEQCGDGQVCDRSTGVCFGGAENMIFVDSQTCSGALQIGTEDAPFCSIGFAIEPAVETIHLGGIGLIAVADGHVQSGQVGILDGIRVVILGTTPGATIELTQPSGTIFTVPEHTELYVTNLNLVSIASGTTRPDVFGGPGSMWIDDVDVTGFHDVVRAEGDEDQQILVRRSRFNDNEGYGIITSESFSGEIVVESSAIAYGAEGGIHVDSGRLDVSYSTIIGNGPGFAGGEGRNVWCAEGSESSVRNSIVFNEGVSSGQSSLSCSSETTVTEPLQDAAGAPETYSSLFVAPMLGDVGLQEEAASRHFDGLGVWRLGDPLYDIDGDLWVDGVDDITFVGAEEGVDR